MTTTDGDSPLVDSANSGNKKITGHEQTIPVLASLVLLAITLGVGITQVQDINDHWRWYVVTGVQTFFAFLLPVAYPGYATFSYTAGIGNDGPATRFEAFYINSTMGMVLGIANMAFIDHFMFFFTPFVMVFGWMPSTPLQVIASGLACLCGLYMALWIPTNIATKTKDPGPFILCSVFVICSFLRILEPNVAYEENKYEITILIFNIICCVGVLLLAIRGVRRAASVSHTMALVKAICDEIGEGPIWAAWPKEGNKDFPPGWWFPPPPLKKNNVDGWPLNDCQWPLQEYYPNIPSEMIIAAKTEMLNEFPDFISVPTVVSCLSVTVLVFVVVVASL